MMMTKTWVPLLLGLLLAGCLPTPGPTGLAAYQAYDRPARLPTDPAKVRVKVSLIKQLAYVMENGELLLVMPVGVGRPETPTPLGSFRITRKIADFREEAHGFAFRGGEVKRISRGDKPAGWSFTGTPLPYWCEFQPSLAFHTGWVRHTPGTNGSIRMHENLAPKFFGLVSVGTPVEIAYSQPEDEVHGHIPLPPDAGPLADYPDSMYLGDGYFRQHKPPVFE